VSNKKPCQVERGYPQDPGLPYVKVELPLKSLEANTSYKGISGSATRRQFARSGTCFGLVMRRKELT
jgi:hypothetical protein